MLPAWLRVAAASENKKTHSPQQDHVSNRKKHVKGGKSSDRPNQKRSVRHVNGLFSPLTMARAVSNPKLGPGPAIAGRLSPPPSPPGICKARRAFLHRFYFLFCVFFFFSNDGTMHVCSRLVRDIWGTVSVHEPGTRRLISANGFFFFFCGGV